MSPHHSCVAAVSDESPDPSPWAVWLDNYCAPSILAGVFLTVRPTPLSFYGLARHV
ncbi:hypothetical protein [Natronoglycomyces albus]|uniref:Uncharacterized protein n=1 Tax=Natronoglycomyces albus TaxID=2811108 RepID=A0A895XKT2_9ACTN|nr:hypothetical protein [Natronoglycomyces albus]QSB06331.1 hypothetical protein JQS30_05320 [Natronoglycomyces albus]